MYKNKYIMNFFLNFECIKWESNIRILFRIVFFFWLIVFILIILVSGGWFFNIDGV